MSTLTKHNRLLGEAAAAAKAAREIAEKADAENREMTDDERATFDAKFAEANEKKAAADVAKKDADVIAQAKEMADLIGLPEDAKDDLDAQLRDATREQVRKSLGKTIVESDAFKSAMAPYKGGHVPQGTPFRTDPIPVKSFIRSKSLFTGGSDTSGGAFVSTDITGILEMLGRRDYRLRDLVSVRTTGSDTVEFVRQTSHTNNAAEIAEATSTAGPTYEADTGTGAVTVTLDANGGYKPEGAWAFEKVTATVKTIAEWVPATKRALADAGQLEGLINDELRKDIEEREDGQILNGDGSGENITGILSTSGIQTQAFSTDLFQSVRKGLTLARTVGRVVPNGIVMNPTDVEVVDLAQDANDRYYGLGPFSVGPRTLWGVPIVESEAMSAGHALLGDFSKAVLWDREQTTVTMTDSHADFFIRNLVAVLAEERVAFGVTRPKAFVNVDIAA